MNEVERAPVQTLADHCADLQATAGVAARSRLVRVYEELKLAAHVGQARALAALEVREAADFGPRARVGPGVGAVGALGPPGPDAVTLQEVAAFLKMSVESAQLRLAVATTLTALTAAGRYGRAMSGEPVNLPSRPASTATVYRDPASQTLVMGVLNVTPDSFSDGGLFAETAAAVAHGQDMVVAGADWIDVGGESTRPGAAPVDQVAELARVLPVVRELAAAGVAVSIDTMHAAVARAAVAAGARLVNDVSGGLADPAMLETVAELGAPVVLMHWRGPADTPAVYGDVVGEVAAELADRVVAARAAGIAKSAIIVDPGLGFAKTAAHSWRLLARLDILLALGFPVLVGASRKRFLGSLLTGVDGAPRPAAGRDAATAAVSALAASAGAWGVRVHEVATSADAVRVAEAVRAARAASPRR